MKLWYAEAVHIPSGRERKARIFRYVVVADSKEQAEHDVREEHGHADDFYVDAWASTSVVALGVVFRTPAEQESLDEARNARQRGG